MIDVPWAVLTGAMVVRKDVWEKIPADQRDKLVEIARDYTRRVSAEVRRVDAQALKTMQAQGLQVVKGDAAALRQAAEKAHTVIRGKIVPAALFDQVKAIVGR